MNPNIDRTELVSPASRATVSTQNARIDQWRHEDFGPALWNPHAGHNALPSRERHHQVRGGAQVIFRSPVEVPENWGIDGIDSLEPSETVANHKDWKRIELHEYRDAALATYELDCSEETIASLPYKFVAHLDVHVGSALTMTLTITNADRGPFLVEEAFEIYVAVGDLKDVTVSGLDGLEYTNRLRGNRQKTLHGEKAFITATDELFVSENDFVVDDPRSRQRLTFSKNGSLSTAFWNPWAGDQTDSSWQEFLMVGIGNVGRESILIHPNESHTLSLSIAVDTME